MVCKSPYIGCIKKSFHKLKFCSPVARVDMVSPLLSNPLGKGTSKAVLFQEDKFCMKGRVLLILG